MLWKTISSSLIKQSKFSVLWSTSNPSNTQLMATLERELLTTLRKRMSPVLLSSACSLYFCEQLLLHCVKQTGSKVARMEQNLVLEGNLGDRERRWVTQNYYKKMEIPQVASDPPSYSVPLGFTPTQALLVIHCLNITCYQWLPHHSDISIHLQLSLVSCIL